jgi:hypothetical protein
MTTTEKKNRLEELKKRANELKREADYYNALQLALKLVLNGSYGSFCSQYFVLFNEYVGGTITAQGRELTQKMDTDNVHYWTVLWHEDTELHNRLGLKNVKKIPQGVNVSIYADTDSVEKNSVIRTDKGSFTIEELYGTCEKNGSGGTTISGHESVLCHHKVLNYSETSGLYFTPVKRIIRHKVNKPKWKLSTKDGKKIIVTNDHSMMVIRDGILYEIKPSEIKMTDKIIVYEE